MKIRSFIPMTIMLASVVPAHALEADDVKVTPVDIPEFLIVNAQPSQTLKFIVETEYESEIINYGLLISSDDYSIIEWAYRAQDGDTLIFLASPNPFSPDYAKEVTITLYAAVSGSDEDLPVYSQTIPLKFVPIESVEAAAEITLNQGQFITPEVKQYPEVASQSVISDISGITDLASNFANFFLMMENPGHGSIDYYIDGRDEDLNGVYKLAAVTEITVLPPSVPVPENITNISMTVGESLELGLTKLDDSAGEIENTVWRSSNPDIASVDAESGTVTAISEGYAIIYSESTVDGNPDISATGIKVAP